ncbi:hypothetical protein EON76_05645 [bacterium]|nr:MAG: hypothetical protein EON76_05645 [bacterium]
MGTLALHTTMDLSPAERQSLTGAIASRSEQTGLPSDGYIDSERGGWSEYGERNFNTEYSTSSYDKEIREIEPQARGEFICFADNQDGTSTIRYHYGDRSYMDDTGRPGNSIDMAFSIPAESSAELKELLEVNPSLMNEVVRQQWLSLGLEDKRFKRANSPYTGHTENFMPAAEKRILNVFNTNPNGTFTNESLSYSDATSIAEYQQSVELSVSTELSDNEGYDVRINQAANDARDLVREMRKHGATIDEIEDALLMEANSLHEKSQQAETAEENEALMLRVKGFDSVAVEIQAERDAIDEASISNIKETTQNTPDIENISAQETEVSPDLAKDLDDMMKRMEISPDLMLNLLAAEIDSGDRQLDTDEDMDIEVFNQLVDKRQIARDSFIGLIEKEMASEGVRSVQSRYKSEMRNYVNAAANYGIPANEITFPMMDAEENDRALNMAANQLWMIQDVLEKTEDEFSKEGINSLIDSYRAEI